MGRALGERGEKGYNPCDTNGLMGQKPGSPAGFAASGLQGENMADIPETGHLEIEETLARLGGDRELLEELYAAYSEDTPVKVEKLEQAMAAKDYAAVMKLAHSFKGSSAAIGAVRCRELALELERAAEKGDESRIEQSYDRFSEEVRQVLAAISQAL